MQFRNTQNVGMKVFRTKADFLALSSNDRDPVTWDGPAPMHPLSRTEQKHTVTVCSSLHLEYCAPKTSNAWLSTSPFFTLGVTFVDGQAC